MPLLAGLGLALTHELLNQYEVENDSKGTPESVVLDVSKPTGVTAKLRSITLPAIHR